MHAPGLPEERIRDRARRGAPAAFPSADQYGRVAFGSRSELFDDLDALRLVPPVFMPDRLHKLIELGREPLYSDVDTNSTIGGFSAPLPVFVCAFGSTRIAAGLGEAISRQAGRLGLPMVIGENLVPTAQFSAGTAKAAAPMLDRLDAYAAELGDGHGGVIIQQSTEDADAEVWNMFYSHPGARHLLESGRLGFELKVGQGAKPGLGGLVLLDRQRGAAAARQYATAPLGAAADTVLRASSPGTVTREILHHQVRLMRNNFPAAKVWVKLHPGRDVAEAAATARAAGADAVCVDGAEGGTGWAPTAFLDHVGLPLVECLARLGQAGIRTLASGRIWEGARAVKALALGAQAVGLGRAALLAVDEDRTAGLVRLVECIDLEIRMLVSALGLYRPDAVTAADIWPHPSRREPAQQTPVDDLTR
ncbi:glutamate synthase [Micromonospora rifamycinica]|nr:glutamate synthase [Micromonospora rifamycinica]